MCGDLEGKNPRSVAAAVIMHVTGKMNGIMLDVLHLEAVAGITYATIRKTAALVEAAVGNGKKGKKSNLAVNWAPKIEQVKCVDYVKDIKTDFDENHFQQQQKEQKEKSQQLEDLVRALAKRK